MADQIYRVRDPEGKMRVISGPAGATDEQIIEQAKKLFASQAKPIDKSAQEAEFIKSELTSPLRKIANVAGAIVEPAIQMGSALFAKPSSEIAGLAAAGKELVSPQGGDPTAFKNELAQQLTYEPRTAGGKFVSEKILAPIGSVIEAGAEKIGQGAKAVTGSDIAASGIQEAAMQGVGFLGVKGAPAAKESLKTANTIKAAALKEQKAMESLRNSIRAEGQKIGLIAPAEGAIKETASKIGGVEPHLSLKNTQTATRAIAEDVGLPKGAISDADITARVGKLAADYGVVTKALGKEVPIKLDFKRDVYSMLDPMKKKFTQDPKTFAALEKPIQLLEQQVAPITDATGKMVKQVISPEIVMEKIRQLRSDARKLDKDTTGDPAKGAMAETNYKLANLYEDLMEKVLQGKGKTALLEKFRDSRKQLAQLHVIDAARNAEGMIDMQKLASITGKYGADKRMVTGNIKTVADFANTFKNVSRPIGKQGFQTPSRWELVGAVGAVPAYSFVGPFAAAAAAAPIVARAIAPSLAERGLLQGKPQSYNLSAIRRMAPTTAETGLLGGAFSPYVYEQENK